MIASNPRRNRQTEPAATRWCAAPSHEFLHHQRNFFSRYPDARIADVNRHGGPAALRAQVDAALCFRVPNRIIDEVVEEETQCQPVTTHRSDVRRQIDLQVEPSLVELRFELLLNVMEQDADW